MAGGGEEVEKQEKGRHPMGPTNTKPLFLSTGKVLYDVTNKGHTDGKKMTLPIDTFLISPFFIPTMHYLTFVRTPQKSKVYDWHICQTKKRFFSPSLQGHPGERAQREICIPELTSPNTNVKCELTEKSSRLPTPHQDGGKRCKFSKVVYLMQ